MVFNSENYIILSNLVLRIILIMGMERIIQWCGDHMVGKHMVNTKHRFNISHQLQYQFYRNITKQLQYNLHCIPYHMRKHLCNKLISFH